MDYSMAPADQPAAKEKQRYLGSKLREIKALRESNKHFAQVAAEMQAEIKRLRAENEALRTLLITTSMSLFTPTDIDVALAAAKEEK